MGVFKGMDLQIKTADVAHCISQIVSEGITLHNVVILDDLCMRCLADKDDYPGIKKCVQQIGGEVTQVGRKGAFWTLCGLLRRPVLVLLILVMMIAAFYLPTRVFFVKVEGNTRTASRLIEQHAEKSGIFFGASRRSVRSEKVKNSLLARMPELEWAAVNTDGCTAVIQVREREQTTVEDNQRVSSIVAQRDGIIQSCTVWRGNLLCQIGQAVKTGQVLVSGYTDCGLLIKATSAQAEVFAQTSRGFEAVTPREYACREAKGEQRISYSLRIGKKLIKLSADSGISDAGCVRIQDSQSLVLPGGFSLPVALIKETIISCEMAFAVPQTEDDLSWILGYSRERLLDRMISGCILSEDAQFSISEDVCRVSGEYTCLEMIGRERIEERILDDE